MGPRVGLDTGEENTVSLQGIKDPFPDRQPCSLVTIVTVLFWFDITHVFVHNCLFIRFNELLNNLQTTVQALSVVIKTVIM